MPYRQNNYKFTIDSSFQPFSMQEMLVPFSAYKDAYEKTEEAYQDLSDKADKFKYLSETLPEDSKARSIYEGYANELHKQADDLARNGLGMGNRRALTSLKRRYQGEIGRLAEADIAMQKEKELRRQLSAKDSSMLYAIDNLDIDSFLDNKTPNLYNISGTELYTRGAAAGKAASSRVYSAGDGGSTLGGYYRKWVEKNGYSKESMDAFRANASAIPELQQAADAILIERGVDKNLTGDNLARARQSVINGIIDGAVYAEKVSPVRDPDAMSAQERDTSARGWANYNLDKQKVALEQQRFEFSTAASGFKKENGKWVRDASALEPHGLTNSGNPIYLDEYKNPYALGSDGKTRYYDNDKDGNYTDKSPFTKPSKSEKVTLRKPTVIQADGQMRNPKSDEVKGEPITYNEAVKEFGDVVRNYHPGHSQYYRYYVKVVDHKPVLTIEDAPELLPSTTLAPSLNGEGNNVYTITDDANHNGI